MSATATRPVLQEIHAGDPYRLLVGCVLLNVTTRKQADEVWPILFGTWPTAGSLAAADRWDLEELLEPLGCFRRRATVLKMLGAWLDGREREAFHAHEVRCAPCCGPYAEDSWGIFREGDLTREPKDEVLASRLAELRDEAELWWDGDECWRDWSAPLGWAESDSETFANGVTYRRTLGPFPSERDAMRGAGVRWVTPTGESYHLSKLCAASRSKTVGWRPYPLRDALIAQSTAKFRPCGTCVGSP